MLAACVNMGLKVSKGQCQHTIAIVGLWRNGYCAAVSTLSPFNWQLCTCKVTTGTKAPYNEQLIFLGGSSSSHFCS